MCVDRPFFFYLLQFLFFPNLVFFFLFFSVSPLFSVASIVHSFLHYFFASFLLSVICSFCVLVDPNFFLIFYSVFFPSFPYCFRIDRLLFLPSIFLLLFFFLPNLFFLSLSLFRSVCNLFFLYFSRPLFLYSLLFHISNLFFLFLFQSLAYYFRDNRPSFVLQFYFRHNLFSFPRLLSVCILFILYFSRC